MKCQDLFSLKNNKNKKLLSAAVVIGALRVKGIDTLSRETTFVKIIFVLFCKGIYSIRKEFASCRSKFFPFRVEPFQKGLNSQ